MPWVTDERGRRVWQNADGTRQPDRPVHFWAPDDPNRSDAYNTFGRFLTPHPDNADRPDPVAENIANGWYNFFNAPSARASVAPAPEPPAFEGFSALTGQDMPMPQFQGGGMPNRIPLPEAPVMEHDPALALRESRMRDRQGRLDPYFLSVLQDAEAADPRNSGWLRRLSGALSAAASSMTPADIGTNVTNYWDTETERGRQARRDVLAAALGREGLTDAVTEAELGTSHGNWATDMQNRTSRYERDTNESQAQNNYNIAGAQLSQGAANAQFQAQLAQWSNRQELLRQAQLMAAAGGGEGGFNAFRSLFSALPGDVQVEMANDTARRALASTIEREIGLAGNNASRQRNSVHARMEELAGTRIPEPPRPRGNRPLDPQALARYYERYVPLSSSSVLQNYQGFAPVGN